MWPGIPTTIFLLRRKPALEANTPRLLRDLLRNLARADDAAPVACSPSAFFSYVNHFEMNLLLLATKNILICTKLYARLAPRP